MNIIISGDFFVSDDYRNHHLFSEQVYRLFYSADYRIINLESPLCDVNSTNKIIKTGPYLRSSSATTIPLLKQLKVDLATLANNHIYDYGEKGLLETIKTLDKNLISHVGTGMNKRDAQKIFTLRDKNHKIAIINIAENEWASAGDNSPGTNPMDVIDNVHQIQQAKHDADFIIVIIHGGHEYYHYPSPRMIKQYRFYAENGASVVVGHHSHCISGYEVYNQVPIFYGLGNFMFTLPSNYDSWYTGLLLQIDIIPKAPISFELYPIKRDKKTHQVELLTELDKAAIMEEIDQYNRVIQDNNLIKTAWEQFLNEKRRQYLRPFALTDHFPSKFIRSGLAKLHLDEKSINKQNIKMLLNLIRCEAHAEATKDILARYLNQ